VSRVTIGRRSWACTAVLLLAVGCKPSSAEGDGSSSESGDSGTGGTSTTGGTDTGNDTSNDTGPQNECSLCEQDCPDGQRCVPVSDSPDFIPDFLVCTPAHENPKLIGERCQVDEYYGAGKDDCEVGSFCVLDSVNDMTGFCQANCCPGKTPSGCQPDEICEPFFTGYDYVPPVPLCMPECDPLQPNSCDEMGRPGWTCIPTDFDASCRFLCVPPTPVPDANDLADQGEGCLLWSDCKPGLHCRPSEVVGCSGNAEGWCCTAYCDPDAPSCPDELSCEPFGCEDPNYAHVGACILPG
jgi:hypothetical protein